MFDLQIKNENYDEPFYEVKSNDIDPRNKN